MKELLLPGLIDAHVHLRDPGATHKEDVISGGQAALAGGFVAVMDMPNNVPPITNLAAWRAKQEHFAARAIVDYGLFVGYDGGDPTWLAQVADQAVGLKLYLDETFGNLTLDSGDTLERVFEAWPRQRVIAIHGESASIQVALALAEKWEQRLHICHVPTPEDLVQVIRAKEAGQPVTCEVTPHHLFLSSDDLPRLGSLGQMKPKLCPPQQVARFWQLLPHVDMIASDHAPHTLAEKQSAAPPPGVPGLETTLPLLLHAVDQGRLTLERLIELLHSGPLRAYGLAAVADAQVKVTWTEPYRLAADGYQTRCGWTPFVGKPAQGRVEQVMVRGRAVSEQGKVLAEPGWGQALQRCQT